MVRVAASPDLAADEVGRSAGLEAVQAHPSRRRSGDSAKPGSPKRPSVRVPSIVRAVSDEAYDTVAEIALLRQELADAQAQAKQREEQILALFEDCASAIAGIRGAVDGIAADPGVRAERIAPCPACSTSAAPSLPDPAELGDSGLISLPDGLGPDRFADEDLTPSAKRRRRRAAPPVAEGEDGPPPAEVVELHAVTDSHRLIDLHNQLDLNRLDGTSVGARSPRRTWRRRSVSASRLIGS